MVAEKITGGRNHLTMTLQALVFRGRTHREDGKEWKPDGLRSVFRCGAADEPADLRDSVIHFHIENPLPEFR